MLFTTLSTLGIDLRNREVDTAQDVGISLDCQRLRISVCKIKLDSQSSYLFQILAGKEF